MLMGPQRWKKGGSCRAALFLWRHFEEPKATRQSRARVNRSGLLRYARNDELWIGRAYEIESVGRGIQPQRIAVGRIKRGIQVARRPFAVADERQAADHRAHLMMQEAARGGFDDHFLAVAAAVQLIQSIIIGNASC